MQIDFATNGELKDMSSLRFVSRGGDKLDGALEHFGINGRGMVCLDAGASTGGFTDCLLQRGAAKVYAVDTAYGELAWRLRNDKRVVVLERTNILFDNERLNQISAKLDLAVLDVGWTKSVKVIQRVFGWLKSGGLVVALIKPQYEVGSGGSEGGGGKVLDQEVSRVVAERVREQLVKMGYGVSELFSSPVKGEGGNQEYFVMIRG